MSVHAVLDLVACCGSFVLGNLVLLRPVRNPLVWPLALLSFNVFLWNFADFAFTVSGQPKWHWLDLGLSPFAPTLALQLIATFAGFTTRKRIASAFFHLCAAALATVAWMAFFVQSAREWIESEWWSGVFLAMDVGALIVSVSWLIRHRARASDPGEKRRTQTMLVAMVFGALLATTDFWNDFGIPVPPLANIGTLLSAALLAMASLRFRFLGRNVPLGLAALAAGLAMAGMLGYLALFHWFADHGALVMVATTTLTLLLAAALRQLLRSHAERRDQMEAMATLGRFSAQMAHDLRNPLAALNGAVDYLREEIARGNSLDAQGELLTLLKQQVDRISGVVESYGRLGRMQPIRAEASLSEVARDVLGLQTFIRSDVAVETELAGNLPACSIDREMVARAIENLVRNAMEAMARGGVLRVRTATHKLRRRAAEASITVEDTGAGMDARHAAQAFDEFFTTKPTGTGLGLSFIKRVVHAHGGRVKLASKLGTGTSVTLFFPVKPEERKWS